MNPSEWFTEQLPGADSAFSLKIKKKLHEEQSAFQFLEIYETETFGNLMVIDGCTMVSTRDNFFYHEMMSHPALYTHPNPKRVWIIGGGDCGTLKEVLKHDSVEHAVQIDIDERVTRLAEIYFPELCESNGDPRAELKFIDGIKWVKEAEPNSVDIIIVDSTDPVGPAEGLFSKAFYHDCFNCLSEHGMVVQQSESALYHLKLIGEMRGAMASAGFGHLQTLFFPQCIYPSGWWSATIASKASLAKFRELEAANKPFDTTYYNVDIHRAALAQPEFFKKAFSL
ncbi:polyamine aminopropyltransferase [Methylovulum psychrotolerans]|jgi:spermidine synthase|uniref:Polyamine aminopropyltransferase n=1 Tax=Methylovulum psychrotolerans TaxID=1704499 RepID=A0A2S5CTA7_9GAMM|nr:polyamine aminopropyltransferase [Methylovulum psychrotolerans]MBT9098306.1 polyamine aminopropyltransferase [Methylovulum psychrotolerans]POZ54008.1 polyamine aminopropyltransferase [Methylovulum psychrotolerans]